ncbi:lipid asymmetry ABC transporter MlaABCDEF, periplasmic component MlaC [Campylobacter blaseri]|uniref:Toluene tolerance protein n=1 Tax=Campylobacter blaseri TaxID=2042961 RepID=A0A2P8QZH0_9BACT|nr:ABC transporter substrate-binding protein [Campylobacter blaseri]PSM51646.1 toluene tolerance protein [Campylobacter blaseri]PSM53439.1 toluene tolerance protein [Campylobacter blaseri]QKF86735.1 lipid asymmetry ABC transporter MlaABCDEF, periplasmic component MlaC [Campylobacter blaseri]
MKFMKLLVLLVFSFNLAFSLTKDEIKPAIEVKVKKAVEILKDHNIDDNKKAGEIFEIFDQYFDYPLMARISLSRHYSKLSKEEARKFSKAYEEALKNSFISNLKEYNDQNMEVIGMESPNPNRVYLKTKLISSDKDYPVDFKFYPKAKDNWLIYDIDILGVSLIQTYRSQFEDMIKNDNFDGILEKLNQIQINNSINE